MFGFFAMQAIFPALIGFVFVAAIVLVIACKGLKSFINAGVIVKGTVFGVALVFIVIIGFSVMPFGTDVDTVVAGYNATRTYVQSANTLAVSVKEFKQAVEQKQEDEDNRKNFVPSTTSDLGQYGTLMELSDYESYTEGFVIPAGYDTQKVNGEYQTADKYCAPYDADGLISEGTPIVAKASFEGDPQAYLSKDSTSPCTMTGERGAYLASQCAGFANMYVNDVAYANTDIDTTSNFGAVLCRAQSVVEDAVAWTTASGTSGRNLKGDAVAASEFFTGVTPGTFVRNSVDIHSYIVLGADADGIVIYDCNMDGKCGIKLHKLTWAEFVNYSCYTSHITCIIAPPNSKLPAGCTSSNNIGVLSAGAKKVYEEGSVVNE